MSRAYPRCYIPLSQRVEGIHCAVGTQHLISGDSLSKSEGVIRFILLDSSHVSSSVHVMMRHDSNGYS